MQFSKLPNAESWEAPRRLDSAPAASGSCEGGDFVAEFQIVAAFDAAPIPTTGTEGAE